MKSLKPFFLAFALVFVSASLWAQNKSDVLITIEDQPVTVAEFEAIYNKNNSQTQNVEQKSVEEYLELFINFKLKVKEAEALGLDTVASFRNELEGYVKQLKEPYLIDQSFNDALMQEAYERMKYDVEASHILVRVGADANPADTLKAFRKIQAIQKQLNAGDDFERVAKEKSEDPSVKSNGGQLGYFTVFRMVYPFETAAYSTEVGSISDIVRTDYGYHILKVTNRRPAMGQIRAAHIMVKSVDGDSEAEKKNAEQKINDIYKRLENGEKFNSLTSAYSDDKGSARRGGELPWFGSGRMVPAFEDAVNELEETEFSKPFKTEYGWHIVRLIDKKEVGTFKEVEAEIKQKIAKDTRGKQSRSSLVAKLKKEYKVKIWSKSKEAFYGWLGDEALAGKWKLPNEDLDKKILQINDKLYGKQKLIYTQKDFAKFIHANQRTREYTATESMVNDLFDRFVEEKIINYESTILEIKHQDYKNLVQEYRDGILLFDLMDKKVWSKAIKDTAGLEKFYADHKNDFMWKKRADATVYTCDSKEGAEKVAALLAEGTNDSLIMATINTNSQLGVSIKSGKYEYGESNALEGFSFKKGISPIKQKGENFVVVNIREVMDPTAKKIEEARGLITAAYQEYLEETWIKQLREKYSYEVNKETLKNVNIQ